MDDLKQLKDMVFNEVMKTALVGHLGLLDTAGYPRVIPINFTYANKYVYIHGGIHGEKFSLLSLSPKVTLCVDIPLSLIPSYWVNPKRGCSITQFFKSVLIRGQAEIASNPAEKIFALQALMEKYQPEGGYKPLNPISGVYGNAFERVAVFRIDIEDISVKINLGQKWESSKLDQIVCQLQERNAEQDPVTIRAIQQWRSTQTG